MAAPRGTDTLSSAVIGQNNRLESYVCWGGKKLAKDGSYSDPLTARQTRAQKPCSAKIRLCTARIRKQSRIYGKLSIRARKTFIQKVTMLVWFRSTVALLQTPGDLYVWFIRWKIQLWFTQTARQFQQLKPIQTHLLKSNTKITMAIKGWSLC